MRHSFLRFCITLWTVLILSLHPAVVFADDHKESLVKAAFIYNFVKFVEWPDDKAVSRLSHINICTWGNNGIQKATSVFEAASTDKLKLSLLRLKQWQDAAGGCHILYISDSESAHLSQATGGLIQHPVLTVSDADGFVDHGGMIGFIVHDNKIKIEVNTKSIARAGLRVDAQLLEIALRVIDR